MRVRHVRMAKHSGHDSGIMFSNAVFLLHVHVYMHYNRKARLEALYIQVVKYNCLQHSCLSSTRRLEAAAALAATQEDPWAGWGLEVEDPPPLVQLAPGSLQEFAGPMALQES